MKIKAPFEIHRATDGEKVRLLLFGYGVVRRFFLRRGAQVPPGASALDKKDIARTTFTWGYRVIDSLPDPSHGSSGDPRA